MICVDTFMLVGFSQVLDDVLELQSEEPEDRPTTRLGTTFQALSTVSCSDRAARLLRTGTLGPRWCA